MSSYTTQAAVNGEIPTADLIALLDDDDNPAPGTLNVALLNQVIANASGEVDQACANIYGQQLPFSPVPLSVASMALTITCYRLFRRRETPDEQNKWFAQYSRVRDFLDEVNTSDKHLDDVPPRDFPQGALTGRPTIYSGGIFSYGPLSTTM
jgi:phage gp36-like protein